MANSVSAAETRFHFGSKPVNVMQLQQAGGSIPWQVGDKKQMANERQKFPLTPSKRFSITELCLSAPVSVRPFFSLPVVDQRAPQRSAASPSRFARAISALAPRSPVTDRPVKKTKRAGQAETPAAYYLTPNSGNLSCPAKRKSEGKGTRRLNY